MSIANAIHVAITSLCFVCIVLMSYAIVKERTNSFEALCFKYGGGERVRTDDLLRARQALSQLSYTPDNTWWAREDSNLRPHDYQSCALAS